MTSPIQIQTAGSAAPDPTPRTPKGVPHRGGEPNPSAAALSARFPGADSETSTVRLVVAMSAHSPSFSPAASRRCISAGRSANASAIEISSIE